MFAGTLSGSGYPFLGSVGGLAIGVAGPSGSIYAGYQLADGEDFGGGLAGTSFLTPTRNGGRYMTSRVYTDQGSPLLMRGSGTLGGVDADPWWTGYYDKGRGVVPASVSDIVTISGGVLSLKSRLMQTGESALAGGNSTYAGVGYLSSMVHFARAFQTTAPCIIEASLAFPNSLSSWDVWHPTFWLLQGQPSVGANGVELDFEGYAQSMKLSIATLWTNSTAAYDGSPATSNPVSVTSGTFQTLSFVITGSGSSWSCTIYQAGTIVAGPKALASGFNPARPLYALLSNHMLAGANASVWNTAGTAGAVIQCDWVRAWTPVANIYRRPLALQTDQLVAFNTAMNVVLPSAASVWGGTVTSDVLEAIPYEDNAPGKGAPTSETGWTGLLPSGYAQVNNSSGITITGTEATRPGRLILARTAVPTQGDGCQPQPVTICIGPNITLAAQSWPSGSAITALDVYAACDCGDLWSGKAIVVTGLPTGLSYNSATGLVTGTPSGSGPGSFTVQVTNAAGQVASASVAYSLTTSTAPTVTTQPSISGTPQTGQTLTGTDGAASGSPTPTVASRQWFSAGVAISGATTGTYAPQASDVGNSLTYQVVWANGTAPNATGTSSATAAVTAGSAWVPSNLGAALVGAVDASDTTNVTATQVKTNDGAHALYMQGGTFAITNTAGAGGASRALVFPSAGWLQSYSSSSTVWSALVSLINGAIGGSGASSFTFSVAGRYVASAVSRLAYWQGDTNSINGGIRQTTSNVGISLVGASTYSATTTTLVGATDRVHTFRKNAGVIEYWLDQTLTATTPVSDTSIVSVDQFFIGASSTTGGAGSTPANLNPPTHLAGFIAANIAVSDGGGTTVGSTAASGSQLQQMVTWLAARQGRTI